MFEKEMYPPVLYGVIFSGQSYSPSLRAASIDRVESPTVPDWCDHWPKCYEASGDFDWENEMNF